MCSGNKCTSTIKRHMEHWEHKSQQKAEKLCLGKESSAVTSYDAFHLGSWQEAGPARDMGCRVGSSSWNYTRRCWKWSHSSYWWEPCPPNMSPMPDNCLGGSLGSHFLGYSLLFSVYNYIPHLTSVICRASSGGSGGGIHFYYTHKNRKWGAKDKDVSPRAHFLISLESFVWQAKSFVGGKQNSALWQRTEFLFHQPLYYSRERKEATEKELCLHLQSLASF